MFVCPDCGASAKVPSIVKRIHCCCGFFLEVTNKLQLKKRLPKFVIERYTICKQCEFLFEKKCCFINQCITKYRKKLLSKQGECPLGKWEKTPTEKGKNPS